MFFLTIIPVIVKIYIIEFQQDLPENLKFKIIF